MATTEPGVQVPWDKLLLWVQQQIAHEMQTGQAVALTRPQLQALSQFVSFNEEPDVGDHDYVSLLMRMSFFFICVFLSFFFFWHFCKVNSQRYLTCWVRKSTVSPSSEPHIRGSRAGQHPY